MSNQQNREQQNPPNTPPENTQLYLAPYSRGGDVGGILGWLSQFYGLKVYGNSLLGKRAATEMGYAALLLTAIFLFDLVAWTTLWNMVIHGGDTTVDLLTPFAFLGGLLFAGTIFIYERQFITADIGAHKIRAGLAIALRALVLVLAAIITAQPVEVIVFRGPIRDRIHEESVIAHSVQYLDDLKKDDASTTAQPAAAGQGQESPSASPANPATPPDGQPPRQTRGQDAQENLNEIELRLLDDIDEARRKGVRAEAKIPDLERQKSVAEAGIARARNISCRQDTDEERRRCGIRRRDAIQRATNRRDSIVAEIDETKRAITEAGIEVKQLRESDMHKIANEKLNAPPERRKALKQWIDDINNASPGAPVPAPAPLTAPAFLDKPYDFFKRLRILEDLKDGNPAQMPDKRLNEADEEFLATKLRVPGLARGDQANKMRATNASIFQWQYWIVYFIAMVIPLLVIAFKLIIPTELRDYYSSDKQAEAGNYEAMRLRFTREKPAQETAGEKSSSPRAETSHARLDGVDGRAENFDDDDFVRAETGRSDGRAHRFDDDEVIVSTRIENDGS